MVSTHVRPRKSNPRSFDECLNNRATRTNTGHACQSAKREWQSSFMVIDFTLRRNHIFIDPATRVLCSDHKDMEPWVCDSTTSWETTWCNAISVCVLFLQNYTHLVSTRPWINDSKGFHIHLALCLNINGERFWQIRKQHFKYLTKWTICSTIVAIKILNISCCQTLADCYVFQMSLLESTICLLITETTHYIEYSYSFVFSILQF